MKKHQTNNLLLKSIFLLSFLSFIYLNFIASGDSADFSISSITEYQNVESSALKEFKIISSAFQKLIDIVTLNR